jgi:hypothetical protein
MLARLTQRGHMALWRRVVITVLLLPAAGLGAPVPAQAALAPAPGQSLISVGGVSACDLHGGKAFCWGNNASGELGDGTTTSSDVPVAVSTSGVLAGKTLTYIAADAFGELGDNSTSQSDSPVLAGPQAPANVAVVRGDGTVRVSWSPPARLDGGTLTGYTATADPGGAARTTTDATTCAISGLAEAATYGITVVAHSTAGDSGESAPIESSPAGPIGPIVSGYRNNKCIDDSADSDADDTKIVISDCSGNAGQTWIIETSGTIQVNGKCMDIYRDEKTNNALVELWTCTGGANQQWRPAGGALVNPTSGKCLDDPRFSTADDTQLHIYDYNGGANQQWKLP